MKMPPREFRVARDKRDELKTYRELTLGRPLKTVRQRRRLQASGTQRVLGDGSNDQPYLAVETARYRQVRSEVQKQLLIEARIANLGLSLDRLLEQLRPRIEALTYRQLAREIDDAASCQGAMKSLGRALTAKERAQFAETRAVEAKPGEERSRKISNAAIDQVLGRIEQRQAHNPTRYQTIWAQVVGPEAAQQTQLDRVDATTQTAYFRCYNSVLSADLQRRPGLAEKVARALGVPVRRLRAQF